jgi:hypothetical protein
MLDTQNNVFQFGSASADLPELNKTGFTAKFEPIASVNGDLTSVKRIPQNKAVSIWADDRFLGVTGGRYKIVQNGVLFDALNQAVKKTLTSREINSALLDEKTSDGGAFSSVQYRLPALRQEIDYKNGNGTEVDFTVGFINTFDGSSSVKMRFGCYDLVCLNGMIIGDYQQATGRHTSGFDIDKLAKFIEEGIAGYKKEIIECRRMVSSPITKNQVATFLKYAIGKTENDAGLTVMNRKAEKIYNQFIEEAEGRFNRGFNVFALHSALTYYASHNDQEAGFTVRGAKDSDNEAKALNQRGEQVRNIVSSSGFRSLITAVA